MSKKPSLDKTHMLNVATAGDVEATGEELGAEMERMRPYGAATAPIPMPDALGSEGGDIEEAPFTGLPVTSKPDWYRPKVPMIMGSEGGYAYEGVNLGMDDPGADPLQPTGGGAAAPAAPAAPAQEDGQDDVAAPARKRGGFGLTGSGFNEKYRYTQEDFYGPRKNFTWTDPRGVQMEVPSAGQLPMAIWASRMQQVQADKKETQKAIQDLIDATSKGVKAPDPYQDSMNKFVANVRDRFVSDIAAGYGGDEGLAWKEIANDPATRARFLDQHKSAEALGQRSLDAYAKAEGYLKAAEDPNMHVDPETYEEAVNIYNGLRTMRGDEGPDIERFNRVINSFEKRLSVEGYINKTVLPKLSELRSKSMVGDVSLDDLPYGKKLVRTRTKDGVSEDIRNEIASSIHSYLLGTGIGDASLAEIRNTVDKRLGAEIENVSSHIIGPPSSSGGGGGRPTSASFAGVNEIPIPEGVYTIKSGPNAGKIDEAMAAKTRGKTYKALSLFDVSNNKGVTPQARTFSNSGLADGTRMGKGAGKVHAIATDIVRVGNELFILAKKAPELRVKSTSGSDSDGYTLNTSEDEGGVDWQTFNELPPILINYEMNKGALSGMFPGITDDFVRQQLGPWGETPKKATAGGAAKAVKPSNIKQEKWDALTPEQQAAVIQALQKRK